MNLGSPHTMIRVGVALAVALASPSTGIAQQDHDHDDPDDARPETRLPGHGHAHGDFPEYVDVFFTHHAYLERKLHPSVQATRAEGADTWAAVGELAWRFTDRLGGEIEVPVVGIDPELGDGASGIGDVEVAPMLALVQDPDRLLIVTARSGFVLPTGDQDEGLGIDGWGWEPGLLLWKGFGADRRGGLQAEVGYDRTFADEGVDEEQVVYNVAFSWWLPSNFVPIVEINGATSLAEHVEDDDHHDGDEEHGHAALDPERGPLAPAHGGIEAGEDTVIAGTVGFRYGFANGQQWGAGLQVPFTGEDPFDLRLVVGGIIHLD